MDYKSRQSITIIDELINGLKHIPRTQHFIKKLNQLRINVIETGDDITDLQNLLKEANQYLPYLPDDFDFDDQLSPALSSDEKFARLERMIRQLAQKIGVELDE
jgi:hypothetical protein